MIDNLKIRTYNQAIINRLLGVGGFVVCKSLSNRFDSIQHKDTEKLKIHFFKVKGGFGFVDRYDSMKQRKSPIFITEEVLNFIR